VSAEITIIVCWGVCLGILAFIHMYCVAQNKKKAQIRAAPGYVRVENQEWLDLTDRENPEFVYTL
jgi:ACS family allantoate permease-like MFS transporter